MTTLPSTEQTWNLLFVPAYHCKVSADTVGEKGTIMQAIMRVAALSIGIMFTTAIASRNVETTESRTKARALAAKLHSLSGS